MINKIAKIIPNPNGQINYFVLGYDINEQFEKYIKNLSISKFVLIISSYKDLSTNIVKNYYKCLLNGIIVYIDYENLLII